MQETSPNKKELKEQGVQARRKKKVQEKKKLKVCRADSSSSYVPCFVAWDEPHVSVGGLLVWERSTRKKFMHKQKKVCHTHDRKKGRPRRKQRTSAGKMERCAMKER